MLTALILPAASSASHPACVSRHLLGTDDFDPVVLAAREQEGPRPELEALRIVGAV